MRWLITGGCGFIGRNLARHLLQREGVGVRVLDNLSVGRREDLGYAGPAVEKALDRLEGGPEPGLELVVGDILDAAGMLRATAGIDIVVHLAANTGVAPSVKDPRADCLTNVVGTLNCLEAARQHGVKRFVFASSGAPVGEVDPPIHEEKVPRPVSPYGASKLAGEGYCSAYFRTFGVETVALRFGNVYGPGSTHKDSVVAKFIKRAQAGEPFEIYGDGGQTRDLIYVGDLLAAIWQAATVAGIGGEVFQIATARETTVRELAVALLEALERCGIARVPIEHGAPRQGDVRRNFSDTTKASTRLQWQAAVGLPDGLRQTIEWFTTPA